MSGCSPTPAASASMHGRSPIPSLLAAILCSLLLHGAAFFCADRLLLRSFIASGRHPHSTLVANLGRHPTPEGERPVTIDSAPAAVVPTEDAGRASARDNAVFEPVEEVQSVAGDGADDKVFVQSSLLSVRPTALNEVSVDESQITENKAFGRIVMVLWISKTGEVVSVDVESSDYAESTTALIRDGFRRLRFSPGMIGGTPVNSTMRIEVTYDHVFEPLKKRDSR